MNNQSQAIALAEDLAVLLNSGADLQESVQLLAEMQTNAGFKSALTDIHQKVRQGHMLHTALQSHPDYFTAYYVGMVKSGDASGKLASSLRKLAEQLEKDRELSNEIKSALIYPGILLATMTLSIIIIAGLILPKLVGVFEAIDRPLSPAATVILSIGNFVNNWGTVLVMLCLVTLGIGWMFRATLRPGLHLQRVITKIPLLNSLLDKVDFARFSATLASLLDSGLTQTEALEIASHTFTQDRNRVLFREVVDDINQGHTFGSSVKKAGKLGQLYAHSITAGELAGQLPHTLTLLAEKLEKEFVRAARRVTMIIEPVLVIVLGLIIGAIIYAVFSALQTLGEFPL